MVTVRAKGFSRRISHLMRPQASLYLFAIMACDTLVSLTFSSRAPCALTHTLSLLSIIGAGYAHVCFCQLHIGLAHLDGKCYGRLGQRALLTPQSLPQRGVNGVTSGVVTELARTKAALAASVKAFLKEDLGFP